MNITITLPAERIQPLLNALAARPYGEVFQDIVSIEQQANAQMAEARAKADADAELLRQCRENGQMSARQVEQHDRAGDFPPK